MVGCCLVGKLHISFSKGWYIEQVFCSQGITCYPHLEERMAQGMRYPQRHRPDLIRVEVVGGIHPAQAVQAGFRTDHGCVDQYCLAFLRSWMSTLRKDHRSNPTFLAYTGAQFPILSIEDVNLTAKLLPLSSSNGTCSYRYRVQALEDKLGTKRSSFLTSS